jgi:hypothetical protein
MVLVVTAGKYWILVLAAKKTYYQTNFILEIMKKLKYFLQKWDGVWSVPLAFFIFYWVGLALSWLFGYGTGNYDPAFLQPLFLSAVVVIGATNAGVLGLYFTIRGLHNYLYGQKEEDNKIVNFSKVDWKKVSATHRLLIALGVLVYFITAIIFVYLKLV